MPPAVDMARSRGKGAVRVSGTALLAAADTARRAHAAGLGVNAGHDLNQANLADFLASVPGVLEVSIGHALIGESLYAGMDATVRAYRRIVDAAAARPLKA